MGLKFHSCIVAGFIGAMLATTTVAQGLSSQGTQSYDGNFLKPADGAFITLNGWSYTFDAPEGDWASGDTVGDSWLSAGLANGFHRGHLFTGDSTNNVDWPSGEHELWASTTFSATAGDVDKLMFWGRWDDNVAIFINGVEAVDRRGWTSSYRYLGISDAARDAIKLNRPNVLAVYVKDDGGNKHLNLNVVRAPKMASLPVEMYAKNDYFQGIVEAVQKRMSELGVASGSLSIGIGDYDDPQVVMSAGIGYMDKDLNRPVPRNVVARLASLDKRFTDYAARSLIESGAVSGDSKVLPILRGFGIEPLGSGIIDQRVEEITIDHLRSHLSGLPDVSLDQAAFAATGAIDGNVTREQVISWLISQNLEFKPGTVVEGAYSNSSYDVLRYLVDRLAPGGLNEYSNSLLDDKGYSFHIASGPVSERVRDESGQLLEPWYTTFIEGDNSRGVEALGILASSAEAYTYYALADRESGSKFDGAINGVLTRFEKFRTANNDNRPVVFTIQFNMRNAIPLNSPRPTEFDAADLVNMIRDLPPAAWTTRLPQYPCKTSRNGRAATIVPNCTLDIPSATNWSVGAYNGAAGYASYANQQLRINVNSAGSDHWHVQAVSPVATPKAGDYILTFRAKATAPRSIVVNLGHNGTSDNNWVSYARRKVELTSEMQTYSYYLPAIPADANARLDFNAGNDGVSDVIIDDVYLAPAK